MKVISIQSAPSGENQYVNLIAVETKDGHKFNVDLIRPYNIIISGPTPNDIQELVTTVYSQEHRNLQAERAIHRFNAGIAAFLLSEEKQKE